MKKITIDVEFTGRRPLMFDRYAGDNNTKLPVAERAYLNDEQQLIMPALNVFSNLSAENTKSVCRQFFGKQGKTIALGINAYVNLTPFDIPIEDQEIPAETSLSDYFDSGEVAWIKFEGWNGQMFVHKAVARLKNGIPNPKERPTLNLPWFMRFTVEYLQNNLCTLENLRQAFTMGGTLGMGTFRPFFGVYELTRWEVREEKN